MTTRRRVCTTCKKEKDWDKDFEPRGKHGQRRRTCRECTEHCCYVLTCGLGRRFYRGYTVNPERRLRQHRGEIVGGARTTKRMHNCRFALLIRGFATETLAKRFEKAMKIHRPRARTLKQAIDKALVLLSHDRFFAPYFEKPLRIESCFPLSSSLLSNACVTVHYECR